MKKVFVVTMFGEPFPWIEKYIDHVQHLEKYGWYWKIFTPANLESKGNVEIIDMDCEQFNKLVKQQTGVEPNFFLTVDSRPSVHITDYYVASGVIFEAWLQDADFWGITNLDVVYGRLDHFYPDNLLEKLDVLTDDIDRTVNGVFSLWRNTPAVNKLFRQIPNWTTKFAQPPCEKCVTGRGSHTLFGTDEYDMTEILRHQETLKVGDCWRYPTLSHDRMEQHIPEIKLKIEDNGELWELFEDIGSPEWIHARPFLGRELPYFHFIRTKTWPKCLKS